MLKLGKMPLDGVYMMWISCYMQKKQKEKLDNHKLNIIKKKIGRKKKKINGIIRTQNKVQDKWRKEASKDGHGDDTWRLS